MRALYLLSCYHSSKFIAGPVKTHLWISRLAFKLDLCKTLVHTSPRYHICAIPFLWIQLVGYWVSGEIRNENKQHIEHVEMAKCKIKRNSNVAHFVLIDANFCWKSLSLPLCLADFEEYSTKRMCVERISLAIKTLTKKPFKLVFISFFGA